MSIWRLILREILYRKSNFLLAVLAVTVAVGCSIAELTVLRLHDLATDEILARKEQETAMRMTRLEADTKVRMAKLEDDYRKITLAMGYNILILPRDQDLWRLRTLGYVEASMPEEDARKLAESKIVSINHLLPMVQELVDWPEIGRKVLLTGTRGEVPLLHANPKKPILYPVPRGTVAIGYQLQEQLKLHKGDTVTFRGRKYTINNIHPRRGDINDLILWMSLEEAQTLLDRPGRINLIMALECNCAAADRLGQIRQEIHRILPETHVEELEGIAVARARARNRARQEALAAKSRATAEAQTALASEIKNRDELRNQYSAFAAVLVPLALVAGVIWLGLTTLNNVRERQGEIGILRALGLPAAYVYRLFISRAVAVGLLGAALGYSMGLLVGWLWGERDLGGTREALLDPVLLLIVVLAAPALSALIGWMAAAVAVREDPAAILRQE
jgi:hypothetical protein